MSLTRRWMNKAVHITIQKASRCYATAGRTKQCVPYQVEALMASDVIGGPDEDGGAPVDEL